LSEILESRLGGFFATWVDVTGGLRSFALWFAYILIYYFSAKVRGMVNEVTKEAATESFIELGV
jgi:hypothetical protein